MRNFMLVIPKFSSAARFVLSVDPNHDTDWPVVHVLHETRVLFLLACIYHMVSPQTRTNTESVIAAATPMRARNEHKTCTFSKNLNLAEEHVRTITVVTLVVASCLHDGKCYCCCRGRSMLCRQVVFSVTSQNGHPKGRGVLACRPDQKERERNRRM